MVVVVVRAAVAVVFTLNLGKVQKSGLTLELL